MGIARAFISRIETADVAHESEVTAVALGTVRQQYGLLACEETVLVNEVWQQSGDLAVADRMAFLLATRHNANVAVFQQDGWFRVGPLDRPMTIDQLSALTPVDENVRIMSIASSRGVVPVVGPLA
ncbi:MAG: hypothetical protein H7123_03960 [Thermoleophilia bacterium]|nr:hypothetical protein [Thermoleophilia bacterium]